MNNTTLTVVIKGKFIFIHVKIKQNNNQSSARMKKMIFLGGIKCLR